MMLYYVLWFILSAYLSYCGLSILDHPIKFLVIVFIALGLVFSYQRRLK
jgi:hypothetical protein